jgi:hypothetical protein
LGKLGAEAAKLSDTQFPSDPALFGGFAFSGVSFSAEWLHRAGLRISPAILNLAAKIAARREHQRNILISAICESGTRCACHSQGRVTGASLS